MEGGLLVRLHEQRASSERLGRGRSLFGLAVMSGLLNLSEINRRREPGVPAREVIVESAQVQFRPVLMVIVVAALGMVPAMVAGGIGSDIQRPLATVVVGGLISMLLLTPLALPAVYQLGGQRPSRRS